MHTKSLSYQSTPAPQHYEHCSHTGPDAGTFVSNNGGSPFILCLDTAACMARQGFGPEPEPDLPSTPAPGRRPSPFKWAGLRRLPDGRIEARGSDGVSVYQVTLEPASCSCPGWTYCGRNYYQPTARARDGAMEAA